MILVVLVDGAAYTRHLARAITDLGTGVVCTAARDLDDLAETLRAALPDLVVTDLSHPGTRGPADCLDAVRSLWSGPLAVLTGDAGGEAESACVTRAATRWLKPMTPAELCAAMVARVAECSPSLPRRIA